TPKGGPPQSGRTALRVTPMRWAHRSRRSLDADGGASGLEGLLGLVCSGLVDLLQDRLRGTLDELLGLLQAEGGQGAHLLDDVDLLVTSGLEDDVELVLLGSGLAT